MIEQEEGAHALKGNVKVFPCLQANRQLERTFSLSLSHFFTLFSSNCINGHAGRPPSSPRNSLVMEKLEISNALQSKRSCTSRPASFGSIIIIVFNMKSHFPQVRRTTRMAQLPRRMGQCQEWMRFGTSKRRMPTESRTHFSGRPWWYATATDTTL